MLNLIAKIALGVGAVSYAGTFNIGVVADQDAYPDSDSLATVMRDDLEALAASVRVTTVVTSRDLSATHTSFDSRGIDLTSQRDRTPAHECNATQLAEGNLGPGKQLGRHAPRCLRDVTVLVMRMPPATEVHQQEHRGGHRDKRDRENRLEH